MTPKVSKVAESKKSHMESKANHQSGFAKSRAQRAATPGTSAKHNQWRSIEQKLLNRPESNELAGPTRIQAAVAMSASMHGAESLGEGWGAPDPVGTFTIGVESRGSCKYAVQVTALDHRQVAESTGEAASALAPGLGEGGVGGVEGIACHRV
jgi:hypothetical protein